MDRTRDVEVVQSRQVRKRPAQDPVKAVTIGSSSLSGLMVSTAVRIADSTSRKAAIEIGQSR